MGGARRPDLLQDKVTSFQADAQQPAADAAIRDAATVHATDAAVADANAVDAEGDGTIRALERAAATIRELEAALAAVAGVRTTDMSTSSGASVLGQRRRQ